MLEVIVIILFLFIIAGIVINYNAGIRFGTNLISAGILGIIIITAYNNWKNKAAVETIMEYSKSKEGNKK